MTKNYLFLFIVLISCNQKDPLSKTSENYKTQKTSIPFSGFWVNETYIKSVQKTKSPRLPNGMLESCIKIPTSTLSVTRMVSGFYDGGPNLVILKKGNSYQFWSEDLEYKGDEIEVINKTKIKIKNQVFIKMNDKITIDNPTILEEILFKGTYKNEAGEIVEFKSDGQISGLKNFTFYSAVLCYTGPGLDVDQIAFGKSKSETEIFAYKYKNEDLEIYELKCIQKDLENNICEIVDYGKLLYVLKKIK